MPRATSEPPPRVLHASHAASALVANDLPPPVGIEIAFAGRSNVGKSSLLNALLDRRNLVRTSSTPGRTRGIVLFTARLADDTVLTLADLPGYGYAKRSKQEREQWAELAQAYLLGRPTLAGVVLLVDIRRGVEADDRDLLDLVVAKEAAPRPEVARIVVATKMDKVSASARLPALQKVVRSTPHPTLGFSVKDRTSREALWREILGRVLRAPSPQRPAR